MSENGIIAYDLTGNFCEECGRSASFRLWPGMLTGCRTCDEVITRHRCTGRTSRDSLDLAETWTCPDCGSAWQAIETEDTCAECGRSGWVPNWSVTPGPRLDTAPRYRPISFTPFRNLISRPVSAMQPMGSCHQLASGAMVHVKPGCRC